MDQHLEAGVRGFEVGNESIALGQGFCTVIFLHMNYQAITSTSHQKSAGPMTFRTRIPLLVSLALQIQKLLQCGSVMNHRLHPL